MVCGLAATEAEYGGLNNKSFRASKVHQYWITSLGVLGLYGGMVLRGAMRPNSAKRIWASAPNGPES
jgi:hypothetical protein